MVKAELNVKTWYSRDGDYSISVDRSGSWSLMSTASFEPIDEFYRDYKRRYKRSPRQMAKVAKHILEKKGIAPSEQLINETRVH